MVTVPVVRHDGGADAEQFADLVVGRAADKGAAHGGGPAPALGVVAVVLDTEDEFFSRSAGLGVVLHEEFLIDGVQDIAHVDHGLGCILGILPTGGAGVDLGVEVHAGEERLH